MSLIHLAQALGKITSLPSDTLHKYFIQMSYSFILYIGNQNLVCSKTERVLKSVCFLLYFWIFKNSKIQKFNVLHCDLSVFIDELIRNSKNTDSQAISEFDDFEQSLQHTPEFDPNDVNSDTDEEMNMILDVDQILRDLVNNRYVLWCQIVAFHKLKVDENHWSI